MRFHRLASLLPAAAIVTIAFFGSCSNSTHKDGVALTGTLAVDSIEDFVLTYNVDGDIQANRSIDLVRDENGNFEIADSLIPAEGTHATILADDCGYFGVWIEPGKTAHIDITGSRNNGLNATFSGENADVNDVFNEITRSYDIMIYTPQDPSERMSKEEAMNRLTSDRQKISSKIAGLKDEQKVNYYSRYADLLSDRMEGFIIEDAAYDADVDPYTLPEYQALIAKVDPNEDAALDTGMIYIWLNSQKSDSNLSTVQQAAAKMDIIAEKITNKRTKKALFNMLGNSFFAYSKPSPEEAAEFMKIYGEKAKDYPEFIDRYAMQAQGVKVIKAGDTISYDPTIATIDGKECKLSSLYGKLLYIDFWATWCGPCCKQIPHLEKLVEKMKGVEGIEFVSISCDSDLKAWKAKVEKDKPEWPQYVFVGGDGDAFMTSMNITGIPRFMIIAPDGKILNPEAPMPSDPKLEGILRGYLK